MGDTLYDLRKDPFEMHNVVEKHPEVASELRATLFERIQENRSKLVSQEAPIIDAKTLEQLRALGYVD